MKTGTVLPVLPLQQLKGRFFAKVSVADSNPSATHLGPTLASLPARRRLETACGLEVLNVYSNFGRTAADLERLLALKPGGPPQGSIGPAKGSIGCKATRSISFRSTTSPVWPCWNWPGGKRSTATRSMTSLGGLDCPSVTAAGCRGHNESGPFVLGMAVTHEHRYPACAWDCLRSPGTSSTSITTNQGSPNIFCASPSLTARACSCLPSDSSHDVGTPGSSGGCSVSSARCSIPTHSGRAAFPRVQQRRILVRHVDRVRNRRIEGAVPGTVPRVTPETGPASPGPTAKPGRR